MIRPAPKHGSPLLLDSSGPLPHYKRCDSTDSAALVSDAGPLRDDLVPMTSSMEMLSSSAAVAASAASEGSPGYSWPSSYVAGTCAAASPSACCAAAANSPACLSVAACTPSAPDSEIFEVNSRMARSASSLPGIT